MTHLWKSHGHAINQENLISWHQNYNRLHGRNYEIYIYILFSIIILNINNLDFSINKKDYCFEIASPRIVRKVIPIKSH